jgi:Methane/Phenol/Toluene Hydroxylase/MmoB/DmpM family
MSTSGDPGLRVGPVLHATPFARAVVSVIEEENPQVLVHDEGAYLRVLVPLVCRLSRAGLEAATGGLVRFPGERELLERALIAYDWGEAFTVTNLVAKPPIDRLVNQEIAGSPAAANGDPLLRASTSRSTRTRAGIARGPRRCCGTSSRTPRERRRSLRLDPEVEPACLPGTGSLR